MSNPLLLTSGAVGEALRVDPRTVVRWAESGELPFVSRTSTGAYLFDPAVVAEVAQRRIADLETGKATLARLEPAGPAEVAS